MHICPLRDLPDRPRRSRKGCNHVVKCRHQRRPLFKGDFERRLPDSRLTVNHCVSTVLHARRGWRLKRNGRAMNAIAIPFPTLPRTPIVSHSGVSARAPKVTMANGAVHEGNRGGGTSRVMRIGNRIWLLTAQGLLRARSWMRSAHCYACKGWLRSHKLKLMH